VLDFLVIGILTGAAYALLAVGFVLVYKGTRIFNLAQGEIGALGLYVAWSLLGRVPVAIAALAGVAVAAATGLVVERTIVRRLAGGPPLAALASTLGVALTLAYVEVLVWGANVKTFPSPVGSGAFRLGSVTITAPRLAALATAGAVALGLGAFLRRTRFGLAVRAGTSDATLARISGVPVGRMRSFVWIVGGALAGVAAILLASVLTFHPLSNTLILVRAMAGALLGGLTSLSGAFVGGLTVGVVESLVQWQTPISGVPDAAIFALILGTLLVRPRGLWGTADA
jgi:branched-chain amino acid transport system permease protein